MREGRCHSGDRLQVVRTHGKSRVVWSGLKGIEFRREPRLKKVQIN